MIMVDDRKRAKTWRAVNWMNLFVEFCWLPVLTLGEIKFVLELIQHCNWDNHTSRPGDRHIERETGLRQKYQPGIAFKLWKYGLITGRFEVKSYGRVSWGFVVNQDISELDSLAVSKIRKGVLSLWESTFGKGGCFPSGVKLLSLWPATAFPPVVKPDITLKNHKEPGAQALEDQELLRLQLLPEEEVALKRYQDQGYPDEKALELIMISRRAAVKR